MDIWHGKIKNSDELSAISNKLRAHYKSMKTDIDAYHTEVSNQQRFRNGMTVRKKNLNDANQNAANSEESASGAEEMDAQAEKLIRIVEDLETMVEGHQKPKNMVDLENALEESNKALICDFESH